MAKLRMAHASTHGARKHAWRTQAAWAKTYVLSIGEYDERVFLGEEDNEEIGNVTLVSDDNNTSFVCFQEHQRRCCASQADMELGQQIVGRRNLQTQFSSGSLIPCTHLSGRHYLRVREQATSSSLVPGSRA